MEISYERLKETYDEISSHIRHLHKEQNDIAQQMREVCPHNDLIEVEADPFSEYERTFKCKGCFKYFKDNEIDD